jgi:hypothetical protein
MEITINNFCARVKYYTFRRIGGQIILTVYLDGKERFEVHYVIIENITPEKIEFRGLFRYPQSAGSSNIYLEEISGYIKL